MVRKVIADLHNHSKASDGESTPAELIVKAKALGLKTIALTDHDTFAGLDEAKEASKNSDMQVIPGVEVSIRFKRPFFVGTLHVLLYFTFDLFDSQKFKENLHNILSQGRGDALIRERVRSINEEFGPGGKQPILSRPLVAEEISSYSQNVTRRHFALALTEKYGIEDREQVNKLIANDSPAYVPSGIEMNMLKPLLREFPVVCVFAHPAAGSYPEQSHYNEVLPPLETVEKLLPEFLDKETLGIDGLEVYYPGHIPEHRKILLNWADRYNLIVTGGSDYHDNLQRPLGVEGMTQEELNIFMDKLNSKNIR